MNFRLRDWGVSRQRYWGNPIPVIYCELCGTVPVPERDPPVTLPMDATFTGEGGNPLAKVRSFVNVTCPQCGEMARRETDTWYVCPVFLVFPPATAVRNLLPDLWIRKKRSSWMSVDQYIGGIEHAVLHLLYARVFYQGAAGILGHVLISMNRSAIS